MEEASTSSSGVADLEPNQIFNAPAKFKSIVWKYFGFYKKDGRLDKTHVICKECRASKPYNGSTTNMGTHLRQHGIDVVKMIAEKEANNNTGENEKITSYYGNNKNKKATPFVASSSRAKEITEAIAYFICKDLQPYSVVQGEGFKHLMKVLEPRYKIPDRTTFAEAKVPALYDKVKVDIKKSMRDADRIALTADGWTSCATQSYITVTAHHIDKKWEMQNAVLQTREFHGAHTGVNLSELLRDVCEEWNISDKQPALVTDNARNMILAGSGAEMKPHVRCIAHTLNLSSQKVFKVQSVSELMVKIRKVVTYFHKSTKACEALHEKQNDLSLEHHKLVHDVSTRWNSSLEMVERYWEQEPAVALAMRKVRPTRGDGQGHSLTEEEALLLPEIIKLMTPLKVSTKLLSEEKTPTLSIIAPMLAKLRKDFEPDDNDPPVITEMKQAFRLDFDARYTYIQDLLNRASSLDPRFKDLEFLPDSTARDMVFLEITAEVEEMVRQKIDYILTLLSILLKVSLSHHYIFCLAL